MSRTKPPVGKRPEFIRFVLYSCELGVYLGKDGDELCWSLSNPKDREAAPTFSGPELLSMDFTGFPRYHPVEVIPSMTNNEASKEDCARSLLPTW